MRHSLLTDTNFMAMAAATIHAGNPTHSIKDSAATAFDLVREVERLCQIERDKVSQNEAPQERQC